MSTSSEDGDGDSGAGGAEVSSSSTARSNLTCAVCLEVYRDPKFLPCHHTFCAQCIRGLTEHAQGGTSSSFPCPQCRQPTPLPRGGVSALQTNFYFRPEDLEKARNGQTCPTHSQKDLEFFCLPCDVPICINCKMTRHEGHETQDLPVAAERKRAELLGDWPRLQKTLIQLRMRAEAVRRQQQSLRDRKTAVEAAVHARHAALVLAADRVREAELGALHALTFPLETGLNGDLQRLWRNLEEVGKLDQRLEQAISSKDAGCPLLNVAKELKDGRWSHLADETLTSVPRRSVGKVRLRFQVSSHMAVKRVRDFVGRVSLEPDDEEDAEDELETPAVLQFRCGLQDKDVEIYSVCPAGQARVMVSYARRGRRQDAPAQKLDEWGNLVLVASEAAGKVSWMGKGNGQAIYPIPEPGWIKTYNKRLSSTHFRLENDLSGMASMKVTRVLCKDPWTKSAAGEFPLRVGGPHRAHDVDDTQQLIAVVLEAWGEEEGEGEGQQVGDQGFFHHDITLGGLRKGPPENVNGDVTQSAASAASSPPAAATRPPSSAEVDAQVGGPTRKPASAPPRRDTQIGLGMGVGAVGLGVVPPRTLPEVPRRETLSANKKLPAIPALRDSSSSHSQLFGSQSLSAVGQGIGLPPPSGLKAPKINLDGGWTGTTTAAASTTASTPSAGVVTSDNHSSLLPTSLPMSSLSVGHHPETRSPSVLRESQAPPAGQRRVLLFHRDREDAVAVYTPPSPAFQPSDVCFYRLGGQPVLLVADEAGDSVHVLSADGGTLTFLCYLAPTCPLIVQPTALNVDLSGRLWLACRGGNVLTVNVNALSQ